MRVLLADDHELVRAGVRRVLESVPGVEVVGEAARGDETLEMLARLEPDVLLLDLNMPGGDGFEVLRRARDAAGGTRIVVLSLHVQAEYVRAPCATAPTATCPRTWPSRSCTMPSPA